MNREELIQLRDAIDLALALPDSVRKLLAQWLAPETAKPNGHDPHPPPLASASAKALSGKSSLLAQKAEAQARASEQRLLAAMRDNPGLTVVALANAAGASRSAAGERLRQLAVRGAVEKDTIGRWRIVEEKPREDEAREAPGPQPPSPN